MNYRHDHSENDIIEAIVHRKPISIKAMYYLLEKRIKQGLNFPDVDLAIDDNELNLEVLSNKKSNNTYINNNNTTPGNVNNSVSALTKHNSQLLPKRNAIRDNHVGRTASQKNVDFKFIYNNLNYMKNKNESEATNGNTISSVVARPESALSSKSPSPDFSLAINPIKTVGVSQSNVGKLNNENYKSSGSNYQDIVFRKSSNCSNTSNNVLSNPLSANTMNNNTSDNVNSNIKISNAIEPNKDRSINIPNTTGSRNDRYFMAISMNNNPPNGIRSLPGSIYRGSPERSLPRSPDYTQNNNHSQINRPTTSRVGSSKPSISTENSNSEKYYDTNKFKTNYYISKRSLTSCDETGFESRNKSSNILKSRQLQMGKAKIDLGTQQSKSKKIYCQK